MEMSAAAQHTLMYWELLAVRDECPRERVWEYREKALFWVDYHDWQKKGVVTPALATVPLAEVHPSVRWTRELMRTQDRLAGTREACLVQLWQSALRGNELFLFASPTQAAISLLGLHFVARNSPGVVAYQRELALIMGRLACCPQAKHMRL